MAYAYAGDGALDYRPCQYGQSRLVFRGPRRDLDLPFVAALGGTETYGKFVPEPWPARLEALTGLRMVNLGCVNAGPDVYLTDDGVIEVAQRARLAFVQVMGAANLTNRFYAVHPRRNDRFLRASPALTALYPEVDFTNFHFTRHLLTTLQQVAPRRFETVVAELRQAWVTRMQALVARIGAPVVLVWIADAPAPAAPTSVIGRDPLFVDATMLAAAGIGARAMVQALISPAARKAGVEGMVIPALEAPAAAGLPGPEAHDEIAAALAAAVEPMLHG